MTEGLESKQTDQSLNAQEEKENSQRAAGVTTRRAGKTAL